MFQLEQCFASRLEEVERAFVDPDLFDHLRPVDDVGRPTLLEREEDGDTVRLQVRYAFTGELAPSLAAVVDPHRLTWVEVSTLDRATHRTGFTIIPDHYPNRLRCAGSVDLVDDGAGGTRRLAGGNLELRIPFVRGRVERAVVDGLLKQAAVQARIVGDWLESRRQAET